MFYFVPWSPVMLSHVIFIISFTWPFLSSFWTLEIQLQPFYNINSPKNLNSVIFYPNVPNLYDFPFLCNIKKYILRNVNKCKFDVDELQCCSQRSVFHRNKEKKRESHMFGKTWVMNVWMNLISRWTTPLRRPYVNKHHYD